MGPADKTAGLLSMLLEQPRRGFCLHLSEQGRRIFVLAGAAKLPKDPYQRCSCRLELAPRNMSSVFLSLQHVGAWRIREWWVLRTTHRRRCALWTSSV